MCCYKFVLVLEFEVILFLFLRVFHH